MMDLKPSAYFLLFQCFKNYSVDYLGSSGAEYVCLRVSKSDLQLDLCAALNLLLLLFLVCLASAAVPP